MSAAAAARPSQVSVRRSRITWVNTEATRPDAATTSRLMPGPASNPVKAAAATAAAAARAAVLRTQVGSPEAAAAMRAEAPAAATMIAA